MEYKHTQIGYVTGTILLILGVGMLVAAPFAEDGLYILLSEGILFLMLTSIFSTLTIEIDQYELKWHFGPIPIIKRSISRSDIKGIKKTKTKIIEGWGIHYTRRGWLYNITGRDAVLIEKSDGSTLMIGTSNAAKLIQILGNRA